MKVVGFFGFSGSGKTTLVEQLIPALTQRGLRVSVVKHAHHQFDIDQPGKDTYRHRQAGAREVVVASSNRLALIREFAQPTALTAHDLIAELDPAVDWVLVEGFKRSNLRKIEIWRPSAELADQGPPRYTVDELIVAVATDAPEALPVPVTRPVLDLNNAVAVADYLIENQDVFAYPPVAASRSDSVGTMPNT